MRLQDLVREKAAPVLEYDDPLLIITLGEWQDSEEPIPGGQWREGYGLRSEWLVSKANTSEDGVKSDAKYREEIRKSTCAWWKPSNDRIEREGIEYVVSAYRGVTRALFRVIEGTCNHAFGNMRKMVNRQRKSASAGNLNWSHQDPCLIRL